MGKRFSKYSDSPSNTNQAIWIVAGQISALSLSIISVAILSRYFSKTEYGTYKQILYIYNTLLVLFSAGLQGAYAYFLPKQTMEQGKAFIIKIIRVFVLLGFIFSVSLFLLAPVIAELFNNPDLKKGLKLFSVVPILMLPTNGLNGVYSSIRKTHVIAIYTAATSIFTLALITVPVIVLKGTYITAIQGWILASLLTCALAVYLIFKPFRNHSAQVTKFKYRDIFKYSLPLMMATAYGILIRFADQFFISRYYGTEVFAEFSNGFIDLPFVSMIVEANAVVLIPLFSKYIESTDGNNNICQTWKSANEKSVMLVYPLLTFFILNAKKFVVALYGEQYIVSSGYFIIGNLAGFFNIIVFQSVIFALGKTRIYSKIFLVQSVLIWSFGFLLVYFKGSPVSYALLSRTLVILQVCIGIYYSIRILKVKIWDVIPFKLIIRTFLHSMLICSLVSWILNRLDLNIFISLAATGVFTAALILVTGSIFNIPYWPVFASMLRNVPGASLISRIIKAGIGAEVR